jgi:hypothetical protein
MDWLKTLVSNNVFLFFFAVVGIPCITMALTEIVKLLIKHRERMAMIEHGMDPYANERKPRSAKAPAPDTAPAPASELPK